MANSSWTKNHIDSVLARYDAPLDIVYSLLGLLTPVWTLLSLLDTHNPPKSALLAYPPCETDELTGFSLEGREKVIVSVAQFR